MWNGSSRWLPTIIVCLLSFLCAQSGHACSPIDPELTQPERFAKATAVFLAHMIRVEESAEYGKIIEGKFRTLEVFKGQPPQDAKVMTYIYAPGSCGLPLLAGADYVFFLREGRANFVEIGEGSFGPFNAEGYYEKKAIGELRALVK